MKTAAHWNKIGLYPHHGIALPLFSLRSQKSCGIGEFKDLLPIIDWCASLGLDVIQILPLYDSGWDPSPYNPLTSCALDPVYLSLRDLPGEKANLEIFKPLTEQNRIDRIAVKKEKLTWLRAFFRKNFSASDRAYQNFLTSHPWVHSYARFKAYKEQFSDVAWWHWPTPLSPPNATSVNFHSYLQFLSFQQMNEVRQYADSRKVFLKGDIPHLISPDSVDVWSEPSLFEMDLEAGSPSDFFNPQGQHWGFPLYRWDAMRQDHYRWWKQKLNVIGCLFHIYRIDHVVGFFRIWGIPKGEPPSKGRFVPADPELWLSHGQEILEMMIDASPLLPMAEDLGTIPNMVRPCLKELGICRTNVIRWERRFETDRSFIPYEEYEPFSLTTVSTPDTDLLTEWWKKYPEEASAFADFKGWKLEKSFSEEHRFEILRDSHHTLSYFHINLLQETLALFPELVHPSGEEERINIPGTVSSTNWTYRFLPWVETMVEHEGLRTAFRRLID